MFEEQDSAGYRLNKQGRQNYYGGCVNRYKGSACNRCCYRGRGFHRHGPPKTKTLIPALRSAASNPRNPQPNFFSLSAALTDFAVFFLLIAAVWPHTESWSFSSPAGSSGPQLIIVAIARRRLCDLPFEFGTFAKQLLPGHFCRPASPGERVFAAFAHRKNSHNSPHQETA